MPALVIAIGNSMRRDDGVAHIVKTRPGIDKRLVLQLAPEIAEEIAGYDTVVFIDADINAKQVRIERIQPGPAPSALTHILRPWEIITLSRALFGFLGEAYACHIPVTDLSAGEGLSPRAAQFAKQASEELDKMIQSYAHCRSHPIDHLASWSRQQQ